jgi:hypothetical protein
MEKVTVYPFEGWDQMEGKYVMATRMGTREAIAGINGARIRGTAIEVDAALVGRDEPGLTDRNFRP